MTYPAYPASSATVVLVHGLYLRGFCMGLLAYRLRQIGYRTCCPSYPSRALDATAVADYLAAQVRTLSTSVVHYVAHSLGGLVVRHLLVQVPDLPSGRVVTLGTPHQGSEVARRLSNGRWRFLLGHSLDLGLLGDAPPWPSGRELGSVAGTLNVGLGRLLATVPAPGDGTVAVAETYLAGVRDHLCLPVSHSGLLLSATVAAQVGAFLANGHFRHDPA